MQSSPFVPTTCLPSCPVLAGAYPPSAQFGVLIATGDAAARCSQYDPKTGKWSEVADKYGAPSHCFLLRVTTVGCCRYGRSPLLLPSGAEPPCSNNNCFQRAPS